MDNLFNYKTLQIRLEKSTRTLFITIHDAENKNDITLEMLFELESILSWSTTRVEIHSIVIDSSTDFFSRGLDIDNIKHYQTQTLEKIFEKTQKINMAMMNLPQTIIFDFGSGAQGIAAELSIGADFRIASVNTEITFNHTKLGLIPCSGGMGFLSAVINPAMAKNWVLSANKIAQNQLTESGFIYSMYDVTNRNELLNKLLMSIRSQAPVQRIQAKLGLLESIRERLENATQFEKRISKAALIAEDWKNVDEESKDFLKAKSMSYSVKLSLVKNDDDNSPLPDNVRPLN